MSFRLPRAPLGLLAPVLLAQLSFPLSAHLPPVREVRLPQGLPILVVERPGLRALHARLCGADLGRIPPMQGVRSAKAGVESATFDLHPDRLEAWSRGVPQGEIALVVLVGELPRDWESLLEQNWGAVRPPRISGGTDPLRVTPSPFWTPDPAPCPAPNLAPCLAPCLALTWPLPAEESAEAPGLQLLAALLEARVGGALGARASRVSVTLQKRTLRLEVRPASGQPLPSLEAPAQAAVHSLLQAVLDREDLRALQRRLEAQELTLQDRPAALAEALAKGFAAGGDWRRAFPFRNLARDLGPLEVQVLARTCLAPERLRITRMEPDPLLHPEDPREKHLAETLLRRVCDRIPTPAERESVVRQALLQFRLLLPAEKVQMQGLLQSAPFPGRGGLPSPWPASFTPPREPNPTGAGALPCAPVFEKGSADGTLPSFTLTSGLRCALEARHDLPLVRVEVRSAWAAEEALEAQELGAVLARIGSGPQRAEEPRFRLEKGAFVWSVAVGSEEQERAFEGIAHALIRPRLWEGWRILDQERKRGREGRVCFESALAGALFPQEEARIYELARRLLRPERTLLLARGDLNLAQLRQLALLNLGVWNPDPAAPAAGRPPLPTLPRAFVAPAQGAPRICLGLSSPEAGAYERSLALYLLDRRGEALARSLGGGWVRLGDGARSLDLPSAGAPLAELDQALALLDRLGAPPTELERLEALEARAQDRAFLSLNPSEELAVRAAELQGKALLPAGESDLSSLGRTLQALCDRSRVRVLLEGAGAEAVPDLQKRGFDEVGVCER